MAFRRQVSPRQPPGKRAAPTSEPLDSAVLAAANPEERLRLLDSRTGGLTGMEAAARLARGGPNEPVRPASAHPLRAFAAQFTHTLALLLWFAGGLAFAANIPALGGAILAVIAVNGVFAFIQEHRAEQVVASLMRSVAVRARVMRDGTLATLPASLLVPGDVVQLAAGDIVPADCVILESENLSADLSMLTGESLPVERTAASSAPTDLDAPSLLPAGSGVVTGTASAVVWATGAASSIGRVATLVEGVKRETSVLEQQVAGLSRITAAVAVLAGASTLGLAGVFTETSFVPALTFATGVIVALVPEGLLPTLSVSLAIGARRMAERGAAVRRLSAVEVVGSVTVICTDKTGTLTENSLTVEGVTGIDGSESTATEPLLAAVLCNDAAEEPAGIAGDPLDVALWRWAVASGMDVASVRARHVRTATIAFDARSRYMEVSCDGERGVRRYVKGAPEAVLALTGSDGMPRWLERPIDEATGRGSRVLLLASGPEDGPLEVSGLVTFSDPPRAGVREALAACEAAGIRVVMLTGDHPNTARAVARTIHLTDGAPPVAEGREIDQMSDPALRKFLGRNAVVARVDPQQKLRIVQVLQAAGEVVVVTGDGVNDAPALRAADVGVAMGRRGTEVAKQAADVVLADDNFATIVAAIEEGRSIRANIRRFISYVFTSNVAEMTPFLLYIFLPVPLALAVIQALAIDVGTDLLPALGLGAERPAPGVMGAPPEPPSRPLLTRALGLRTFLFFGVVEAALGLAGFFSYYLWAGWSPGDSFAPFEGISHEATTVTFLAIVGGQVACLFAQRDGSFWRRLSLESNRWIVAGLVFELVLSVTLVYVPGLNGVFSMAPVDVRWLVTLPLATLAFLGLDELRRLPVRLWYTPPGDGSR